MDATQHQESLAALTSWERWVNSFSVWLPYATLAGSVALAQLGSISMSERMTSVVLTIVAAAWTGLTFTRLGPPTTVPQRSLRIYFVGFVVLAALLMTSATVFLIYAITGFFHASLMRPWTIAFVGIAVSGLVLHSHIVITESTAATWAIYLGVVTIQTVTVAAGLYGGHKISEIAETRRETLMRLETAMDENAGLHAQLVAQAREAGMLDERQRMAREIHDTIAQGLTGVITQIEAAHQSGNDEDSRRHLDNASGLARESLAEARRSVQAILPAPLATSRLPEALDEVATRWSEVAELPVEVHTVGERRPLQPEIEVTLLRAAQEGLANTEKHAKASRAVVTLTFMDSLVTLDVRDDGRGFDVPHTADTESFGLAAMRQRVASVDGELSVESAPGEGTAISVRIPTSLVGAPSD
ncbi:MAG: sensor histidine kinase [bacterium]|nr:sensor histidine kinase [bacterium]